MDSRPDDAVIAFAVIVVIVLLSALVVVRWSLA